MNRLFSKEGNLSSLLFLGGGRGGGWGGGGLEGWGGARNVHVHSDGDSCRLVADHVTKGGYHVML